MFAYASAITICTCIYKTVYDIWNKKCMQIKKCMKKNIICPLNISLSRVFIHTGMKHVNIAFVCWNAVMLIDEELQIITFVNEYYKLHIADMRTIPIFCVGVLWFKPRRGSSVICVRCLRCLPLDLDCFCYLPALFSILFVLFSMVFSIFGMQITL